MLASPLPVLPPSCASGAQGSAVVRLPVGMLAVSMLAACGLVLRAAVCVHFTVLLPRIA